ncbi:MAG: hypothetical protein DRG33_04885 [Deltaproteobacteria bacterium]|nr:MAG: hypothetical protein DRG33_04885 [Deltaproteobacteria bacterium]
MHFLTPFYDFFQFILSSLILFLQILKFNVKMHRKSLLAEHITFSYHIEIFHNILNCYFAIPVFSFYLL